MITWERAKPRQSWLMHGADKACRGLLAVGPASEAACWKMAAEIHAADIGEDATP